MAEISTGKKSFIAMFLSLICPGSGQFYLRKPLKGAIFFFGTALGICLVYANSLPVDRLNDLLLVSFRDTGAEGRSKKRSHPVLILENPESENYECIISVILNSSDFKTVEKELEQVRTIKLFKFSILLPFMNAESFEKTKTYRTIHRFEKREIKFRPIWQFRISGTMQTLFFWLFSIWDGFLGYKGYKRRKKG